MAGDQKGHFSTGGGDDWFMRNHANFSDRVKDDPVLNALSGFAAPARVLEVGASNGWRLAAMKEFWPAAELIGLEPSEKAIGSAHVGVRVLRGTAERLPFGDGVFDLVIFGFCLYLCDRGDLFQIAAEADRVLAEGGHMVTYDFHPPVPYRNPFAHAPGLYSYKMDYSRIFTWNPAYQVVASVVKPDSGSSSMAPDERVGAVLMRKSLADAWPDSPYRKG